MAGSCEGGNEPLGHSISRKTYMRVNPHIRRVSGMSSDIEDIMKEKIKSSQKLSLQIDESTDISGHAQLLSHIRYIDGDVIATTYIMCELGFLTLTEIKTSKRERLKFIDEEIRLALSTIPPRINHLCAAKQAQSPKIRGSFNKLVATFELTTKKTFVGTVALLQCSEVISSNMKNPPPYLRETTEAIHTVLFY
ncbi:hypothetical protein ANN_21432 [Periplaneta americana]|uniref:Uncharacterized protein n=1 Tax=Periplaneta americana TaxID=6978 RepID=A0ABQ8SFA6_PERAM|nr:hypothetical protein ANN_21432 [Periplaneta americana]